MKKCIAMLLAALLVLGTLAACSSGTGSASGSAAAPSGSTASDTGSGAAAAVVDPAGYTVTTGGTLIMGQGAEPITLNPDGKSDDAMQLAAQSMFNRLVKVTNMNDIICDLAEEYSVSDDGLIYTFKLRSGVKFSDGVAMTSDDVKFTFEEIVKQGCFASDSLSVISSIECPDELTVVITLDHVDSGFLGVIGYNGVFILPRHIYEGQDWMGADSMQTPVGTGAFVFDSWDSGISMKLVKNQNYFMGPDVPYLDAVIYSYISDSDTALQAFKNGELDILGVIPSDAAIEGMLDDSNYNCYETLYASRFYIGFNMEQKPFDDINFRLAVAHGINIDDLISKAMRTCGLKAETYLSPLYGWACNTEESAKIPEYDKAAALSYMEATGLQKDADGYYCHITMDTYNYEPFPSMAQVLKAQLAEIGIDISINMLEYAAWDENVAQNRDYQMTVVGGYVGPDVSGVSDRIVTGGYFNFMNYSNPELDELMEKAANAPTQEQRAPYYKQVCQILRDDQPMIMIGEWIGYTGVPAYVHNHPCAPEIVNNVGTAELAYVWMEQ